MSLIKLSLFLSFILLLHKSNAINITQLLTQFPDLSNFNTYLTQTNLYTEINSHQTITILAVSNPNLPPLTNTSLDVIKNILSVHVILDYFDVPKLQNLANGSATVTTLFQTTGLAKGQQGFINVTNASNGTITFGSAVPGSKLGSDLVKSVLLQPSNLSILQVSSVIIPQGMISPSPSSSPSESPVPTVSPPMGPPPTPSSPPSSGEAPSPSPSSSPTIAPPLTPGSPPVPGAPPADAPAAPAPAPAPAVDAPTDDKPSAGTTLRLSVDLLCWMVGSTLCLWGTLNKN